MDGPLRESSLLFSKNERFCKNVFTLDVVGFMVPGLVSNCFHLSATGPLCYSGYCEWDYMEQVLKFAALLISIPGRQASQYCLERRIMIGLERFAAKKKQKLSLLVRKLDSTVFRPLRKISKTKNNHQPYQSNLKIQIQNTSNFIRNIMFLIYSFCSSCY